MGREETRASTQRRDRTAEGLGILNYGAWRSFTWDNNGAVQHGVRLVAEEAPWRRLFAALDALDVDVSQEPLSSPEEADAIVACCWRYGSFVSALASGKTCPELRRRRELSRLSDSEMKRINLEFSSGLAAWWLDKQGDERRVNRRARVALATLPVPWRSPSVEGEQQELDRVVGALAGQVLSLPRTERATPEPSADGQVRREANYVVHSAYRNGPIEDFHAGTWNLATEVPGYRRFAAGELLRIAASASIRLGYYLELRRRIGPAGMSALIDSDPSSPRRWSLTEETSPVEYLGMPGL